MLEPSHHLSPCATRKGFTLVELSIVLVIIGLIVGGIVIGRDLIHAAGIRATVSQVEKFRAAINTFRAKYGYLPGDMPAQVAGDLGFFAFSAVSINGNNDGIIQGLCQNEVLAGWRHLSEAHLIDGAYGFVGGSVPDTLTGSATAMVNTVSQSLPPTKMNSAIYFTTDIMGYLYLLGMTFLDVGGTCGPFPSITPWDAYAIDVRLDDGTPSSGTNVWAGGPPGCVSGTGYDLVPDAPPNCFLFIKY